MSKRFLPTLAVALFLATGCNLIYKQNIQQGNALEQEDLDQLRLGMSMNQVAFLLGTPAVQDPFHHDRWDYLSWFSRRGGEPTLRKVTLEFRDGSLVAMTGVDQDDPTAVMRKTDAAQNGGTGKEDGEVAQTAEAESSDEAVVSPLETPAATEGLFQEEKEPPADPQAPVPVAAEPDLESGPVDRSASDAVEEMISVEEIGEALQDEQEAEAEIAPVPDEWMIQLGAFDSEENARRVLERLNDAGYDAVLTRRATTDSGVRYLIRKRGIASRSEAMRLLEEIEGDLGVNGFLVPAGD